MHNLFPQTDTEYLAWSGNYIHRITANPNRYQVSEDDVTTLGTLLADFAEKLFLARQPETRSPDATLAKNKARRAIERAMRQVMPAPQLTLHLESASHKTLRAAA